VNSFRGVVLSCAPCPRIRIGTARLTCRPFPGMRRGQKVRFAVRPEDVLLCAEHPGRISARNVLAGRVRSVRRSPEGARVEVTCGFRLTALVTQEAVDQLRLRKGTAVYVVLKATAIEPRSEVRPRYRIVVLGRGGRILPERVDLLRAVRATGSLLRAARTLGITYRTAWLWSREIRRRWSEALLVRSGRGALLTAQGRALLDWVDEMEKRG